MASTRRSGKPKGSEVLCKPEKELTKCKTHVKRKKVQRGPLEEHQQQEQEQQEELQKQEQEHRQQEEELLKQEQEPQQQQEELQQQEQEPQQQEEEDYLITPPSPVTTGIEVIPLDICSSPEQTKPQVDHLSWLQPVSKVPCHIKVPQGSLERLVDATVVFKDALVSYLEETARNLDIADMVKSANECFTRLSTLQVDYRPFHGEVCTFIKYHHELKKKSARIGLELEADYENSVVNADDVKEGLLRAENKLISAQTKHNSTRQRIEALQAALGRLEVEDAKERDAVATLTAERDHWNEAYLHAEKMVEQLDSLREEYAAKLEEIKAGFGDKIWRSLNRLRELV